MKFFIDTEFVEDGRTIDLISIGIVAEDGRELYLQSAEFNETRANPFVREHVLPLLRRCPAATFVEHQGQPCEAGPCPWLTRGMIRDTIYKFIGGDYDWSHPDRPEFWAWFGSYDWVALCQLFGPMINLPGGWPRYIRDIKQLADDLGNPHIDIPKLGHHNALDDARWNRRAYDFLRTLKI